MKDLLVVCPTRERPSEARAMYESALDTSTADIAFYIDTDDPLLDDYEFAGLRLLLHTGPPIGRAAAVDTLISTFPNYRAYFVASDDITFTRKGWDREVMRGLAEFPDGIGLVSMGDHPVNWIAASRKWIDILGWFNPPGMTFFCQDTILHLLALAVDRITYIPPGVSHKTIYHPDAWKRLADDLVGFHRFLAFEFENYLVKLKGAIA